MTADPFAPPAPEVGCVLGREVGVLVVLTDDGPVRASYGAQMLGAIARDRRSLPEPGEWVALHRWPDGPVTVEGTVYRPPARTAVAGVIALRRPA